MVAVPSPPGARPEAKTFRVEDLIRHARAGRLRVPTFQRGFKWAREDVEKLIDSIVRGFPIGTLLLWSRKAPAERVSIGGLEIDVPEQVAWYVVDGQQRLVSLVSTLIAAAERSTPQYDLRFDLYLDLATGKVTHGVRGEVPNAYLPLHRLVDSEDLLAWIDDKRLVLTGDEVRQAIRVGRAVREYEVPAYIVEVEDEGVVRQIFERTNNAGKRLDSNEVFNALHAPLDRKPAVRLRDVVERLRARGLGDVDEDHVLNSLLTIVGKGLSGDLQQRLRDVDVPAAIARTERALDGVFGFLAQEGGIPRLRLLPYKSPLMVLSTFYDRFPTPSERARRLLVRWLWRGVVTEELRGDGKGMRPALDALRASTSDEEAATAVLSTVSRVRPVLEWSETFNVGHARPRLLAIAMVELRPQHLETGAPLDIAALLDAGTDVFPQILSRRPAESSPEAAALFSSVGNRLLHPALTGSSFAAAIANASPAVAVSHGIDEPAVRALAGDRLAFLALHRQRVEEAAWQVIDNHAEWEHADRLSIEAMSDEEE